MNSIPIGRTWQMIAVDILEVPVSKNNNRYLMVVQTSQSGQNPSR